MKRGWILVLIIASMVVFIGLVWAIAEVFPPEGLSTTTPSITPQAITLEQNCTYPLAYWRLHPEAYPNEIVIGNMVYKNDEVASIFGDGSQDLAVQVKAELLGAFLNVSAGADERNIEATIFEAYGWLVEHPAGSQLSESDFQQGTRFLNVLETYNQGSMGVAACQGASTFITTEAATDTSTPTSTSSGTPNQTVTISPTPSPTSSSTPTGLFATPGRTATTPIYTPTKTSAGPGGPSWTPTRTTAPSFTPTVTPVPTFTPTNTPIPPTPTNTPEPTITPAPSATSTPSPEPTATNPPHPG